MIPLAEQGPLNQQLVGNDNNRKVDNKRKGPLESMPEGIMIFNIHPTRGPNFLTWSIKPWNQWFSGGSENQEAIKILLKNTTAGAFIGGSISLAIRGLSWICFRNGAVATALATSPLNDVAAATAVGGAVGFLKGVIDVRQFYLKRPEVLHATVESAQRAQAIMQAFIEEELEKETVRDIFCPISFQLMVYPAKASCGSKVPHTFEFFTLLDALQRNSSCPTCRQPVNVAAIDLDDDVEREVQKKVGKILEKMEEILQKLPKTFFGLGIINFDDPNLIAEFSGMLRRGENFLSGNQQELMEKIKNPETLTLEETYALAYFLIHQFSPVKKKIDIIYKVLREKLSDMHINGAISQEDLDAQDQKVKNWYKTFNIIPAKCKIIKNLYIMKDLIEENKKMISNLVEV